MSWGELLPTQQGEKIGGGFHSFVKYSHIVDQGPISKINLFLRLLIMNFLPATISSLLPHFDCHFHKSSKKYNGGPNGVDSYPEYFAGQRVQYFFCVRMGFCGLGYIRSVLISMIKDK